MINSRIALSLASIAAAGSLVVGATFALFSNTSTSNGNVFAAGTMHLALCDSLSDGTIPATPEPCPSPGASQNVTGSFGKTNMKPGDCTGDQTLTLKNTGTIDFSNVKITGATNSDGTIAPFLRINNITFDGTPVSLAESGSDGNAFVDLVDLSTDVIVTLPSSTIAAGASKNLVMDVCLDSSATTAVQGLSDTLNLSFTANQ